jgi:integrase/recombinase XerD
MSGLRAAAEEYLRMRRALGYKLAIQGHHLLNFVSYLEAADAPTVTIEHAVAWATCAGTDMDLPRFGGHGVVRRPWPLMQ